MIPSPRLSNKALAELCHRLAVETEAGIDIRRTWQREAESARGRIQPYFARVRDAIARGETLAFALAACGAVFPPIFLELIRVGEETGTLGRVLHRLERHYRRHVQARRIFLSAIAWPMFELSLAIIIVGVLILVLGIIGQRSGGEALDVLGFGLTGTQGLLIYTNFIVAVALSIAGLVYALRRGVRWVRPLQRGLIRLPAIGPCLKKLALARLAWALHLLLNAAIDLRRVVPLALRATQNDFYIRHTARVVSAVEAGQPLAQAFAATGAFPAHFLEALEIGEESGQTAEAMERLADQYEEEAESALRALAVIAGVAVFFLVATLIIFLIFRLFGAYIGTINDTLKNF